MANANFDSAATTSVEHIPPGGGPPSEMGARGAPLAVQPGDFILTHGGEFFSQLIRFAQQLRFRGADNRYTFWNHAALIVSNDGAIVEALGNGVTRRSLADYAQTQFTIVRIAASAEDRAETVRFADACVGLPYGWPTIVSIALSLLTGTTLKFGFNGQMICSGLVARSLERTTAIFKQEPSHIMPAELAKIYKADPPPKNTAKGVRVKRSRAASPPPLSAVDGPTV
jgi:Permuted papain-like amidase enzyme, YaeF/YiiX, C92 family